MIKISMINISYRQLFFLNFVYAYKDIKILVLFCLTILQSELARTHDPKV